MKNKRTKGEPLQENKRKYSIVFKVYWKIMAYLFIQQSATVVKPTLASIAEDM